MNKKYEIFPTSIWKFKVSNYKTLNKNIISEVYKLKENDNDGLTKSNRGGWHSYQSSKLFPKLSKIISNSLCEILDINEYIKPTMIWVNINSRNDYNDGHDHLDAYYSGVYYVKIPKNSGNLYFLNPIWTPPLQKRFSSLMDLDSNDKEIEFEAKEGDLYLFGGKVPHRVGRSLSDEDRISISFNFNFKDVHKQLNIKELNG